MQTLPFSKIRSFLLVISFVILVGGTGYYLGERKTSLVVGPDKRVVVNTQVPAGEDVDFALFWDVWGKLKRYYVDPDKIDVQKLVYGAISGMVSAIDDPYTSFFSPKENQEFKDDLGGQFEGIGAQLGIKEGRIIIVTPLKGNPAEKAGLKPNDFILKVNGEDTTGWTVQQAVTKIRGPRGIKVTLTVFHENSSSSVDVTLERATIVVPSVTSWTKSVLDITEITGATEAASIRKSTDMVSYISLSRFGDHTNEDWDKAVAEIAANQAGAVRGLILDLRNNPGGYLEGSVYIASEFLKSGIVVSQVNSDGTKQEYTVNRKGKLLSLPIVVLINKGSASAAEIVTGALRDYKRATIVGETSFGKGSVQTPFDLSQGAGVHITTGKWLLPLGDSISQKGVTPDVMVALSSDATTTSDGQLAKAIEVLLH
ncbi:MAG: S41 family peptidase [Patescibacteria group bacterium]